MRSRPRPTSTFPDIVRATIERIGYTDATFGFDTKTCAVISSIDRQSPDIAMGVDTGGAGDQGMMFGYASDETAELMPMPILLAHRLTQALADRRKSGDLPWLRPDGKAQVTVVYENDQPVAVDTVVVSAQHAESISHDEDSKQAIMSEIIEATIPQELRPRGVKYHVNPTGRFVVGGPQGDAGLTGRKIIVDTYGGMGRHGGGAFSGKDPSKVDRSACYAARWVAKNIVAAGLGASLRGPDRVRDRRGAAGVGGRRHLRDRRRSPRRRSCGRSSEVFDLTPKAIIAALDLRKPIYGADRRLRTFRTHAGAAGERQGRAHASSRWERTDRVAALKQAVRDGTRRRLATDRGERARRRRYAATALEDPN